MARNFNYQRITQNTRLIYISREDLDSFRTRKLLGLKVIEIEASPINEVNCILHLKDEGVRSVEAYENPEGSKKIRFKLT